MLVKTARFLFLSVILGLIGVSNLLFLVDSVAEFHSKVERIGVQPVWLFIICWIGILLIRIKWFRNISAFWMYTFLYIVVPVSTIAAVYFTHLEVSHYFNFVYSRYGIYFQSVVLWCFSSWLFTAVLMPERLFRKYWRRVLFIAPVLFLIGMAMVWLWPQDVFLDLVKEDHLIENTQVIVLLTGSVSSFLLGRNFLKQKKVLMAVLFFVVCGGLLFISGDEVDWGQRLLGYATPQEIAKDNLQGEVTVHNLNGIHQLIVYGYLLVGLYGAFVWIVEDLFFKKYRKNLKLFVPPQYLFFYFYLSLVYNAYSVVGPHAFGEWSEVSELLLYSGVSLFLLINYLEIKFKKF